MPVSTSIPDVLATTPGHESTLSILASVRAQFWLAVGAADSIRSLAGHGRERFPDGAPPKAGTYRNRRLVLQVEHEVETTAADRTFAGQMVNLGGAVG